MQDYLHRLLVYSEHSNEVLVCALVYLQRLFVTYPEIDFAPEEIHRLVISSFVVSAKMHEMRYIALSFKDRVPKITFRYIVYAQDHPLKLVHYAAIGGVSLSEVRRLELLILHLLDLCLFVSVESYTTIVALLSKAIQSTI